ncbi:MAG: DUF547 domain-containing protein [Planctomycetota bacterium]
MNRYAGRIQLISVILIVAGILALVKALPLGEGISQLQGWVQGLGVWGPVVWGLLYILFALAFIPGSLLTMAAGALFGLVWGPITVSIASTTAGALGYLIARHLARDKVKEQARKYPRFAAVDRAIESGGWKIVGMLRLSPAFPYSVSNYLYGLTAIRFWPYVVTSWIAMLPGTFMYVYFGRAGLSLAEAGQTPSTRTLTWVGLLLTVVVTVYITRLAGRTIREELAKVDPDPEEEAPAPQAAASTRSWVALVSAALAMAVVATAVFAHVNPGGLQKVFGFGPPEVVLKEAYPQTRGGPTLRHAVFDKLLKKHVDKQGYVDYAALQKDSGALDGYIEAIGKVSFGKLNRNEKLAFLINAYNAFTLKLILEHLPVDSIKKIPRAWDDQRWKIGSETYSLNQIEHGQIRPRFKEPRIHFALVCAAVGCPPLRNEAYRGKRLEEQLVEQARTVHSDDRWFQYDPEKNQVSLTKLYKWYGDDFAQVAGSALEYAARYHTGLKKALAEPQLKIRWLDYDWKLNSKENAP